jgi:opacity protein-like surface antigen
MTFKTKTLVAAALVVAAVGAGAAVAAQKLVTPKQESQAIINDAANRLGVQPTALSNALKAAFKARVDAAVADGRLTKAQADDLKARIDSGDVPFFGGGFRGGFGHGPGHHGFGELDVAASYLGVTEASLRESLMNGKTLAQVAKDRNKSASGLVEAIVAEEKKELAAAVTAGRLTDAQRDSIEQGLPARVEAMVNGERPSGMRGFRMHPGGESFRSRHPSSGPVF